MPLITRREFVRPANANSFSSSARRQVAGAAPVARLLSIAYAPPPVQTQFDVWCGLAGGEKTASASKFERDLRLDELRRVEHVMKHVARTAAPKRASSGNSSTEPC